MFVVGMLHHWGGREVGGGGRGEEKREGGGRERGNWKEGRVR